MIADASKTVDTLKLRFYTDYMYNCHIYAEGPSEYHKQLTGEVVKQYIDPLNLPKNARILDLGCGPGYFLDEMHNREMTNCTGVTLSPGDIKTCEDNGHSISQHDMSFLPSTGGFYDESADLVFARHSFEHSPWPIITLIEWNRVLKHGGKLYIEVPQPNCDRRHEENLNHYSILGSNQLAALLRRTGFEILLFNNLEFDLNLPQGDDTVSVREKFFCVLAEKKMSLDIK
jgi:SAM-dependent methyltransferase